MTILALSSMARYDQDTNRSLIEKLILLKLTAKGTIKRADVVELCGVTTKQASQILARMSQINGVSVRKAGRSTEYVWNE